VNWSKDENLAWATPIGGSGASSPIVVGRRVYVTSQTDDDGLHVIALHRKTGKILWDRNIGSGRLSANKLHNMATPTPVSDGRYVWALFGTGDLVCLDRSGEVRWQRNLVKEYGPIRTSHGYGTSPMLLDQRLFVAFMHQGPSYVLAVNAKTGENIWKKDRNLGPETEARDSYSSAILLRGKRRAQVVFAGSESVNAYEPKTGEQLWIRGGMKVPHQFGRTIAGPTAGDGVLVAVASGFQNRGYTVGLDLHQQNPGNSTNRLWTLEKFSPDCPTPIIYRNKLYCIRDDGIASCVDVKTGEPHWQERVFSANVKVSPVAGDGKVYFMSNKGNCAVVIADPTFKVLARNQLNDATLSSPAISGGQLFVRTQTKVYCIGQ
jgi:outer membrane protein assembly factor BamB